MIMSIEAFYLRSWKKWVLARGGLVGLVGAFLLQVSWLL